MAGENRWSAEYGSENLERWSRECDAMDKRLEALYEHIAELEWEAHRIEREYERTEQAAAEELREIEAEEAAAANNS